MSKDVMDTFVHRFTWEVKQQRCIYTAEAWGELSQTQRVEISWLGQLQDLQMLLEDLLPLLRGNTKNETNWRLWSCAISAGAECVWTGRYIQSSRLPAVWADLWRCACPVVLVSWEHCPRYLLCWWKQVQWRDPSFPSLQENKSSEFHWAASDDSELLWNVLLTVHLYQQLVEGLLLFSIGETWHVGGALLSHGVDLVDVDDAGCSASSLLEQTPDPSSTQAYTQTQFNRVSQSEINLLIRPSNRDKQGHLKSNISISYFLPIIWCVWYDRILSLVMCIWLFFL